MLTWCEVNELEKSFNLNERYTSLASTVTSLIASLTGNTRVSRTVGVWKRANRIDSPHVVQKYILVKIVEIVKIEEKSLSTKRGEYTSGSLIFQRIVFPKAESTTFKEDNKSFTNCLPYCRSLGENFQIRWRFWTRWSWDGTYSGEIQSFLVENRNENTAALKQSSQELMKHIETSCHL